MGMNLSIKRKSYGAAENQEWLGSAHGTQSMNSITLDAAACIALFPTGLVPSGIKLGKITATGLYAPALEAGTNGSEDVLGHLFTTVDFTASGAIAPASAVNTPASIMWHGEVRTSKMPVVAGVAVAGAEHINYVA